MNYEQKLIEQGIEKGIETGTARLLLKLAQLKFGELSSLHQDQIRGASVADLERWSESILSADSADDLFG